MDKSSPSIQARGMQFPHTQRKRNLECLNTKVFQLISWVPAVLASRRDGPSGGDKGPSPPVSCRVGGSTPGAPAALSSSSCRSPLALTKDIRSHLRRIQKLRLTMEKKCWPTVGTASTPCRARPEAFGSFVLHSPVCFLGSQGWGSSRDECPEDPLPQAEHP